MLLNLSRREADQLDRALDALCATQPDDEWTPALQDVRVKRGQARENDEMRRSGSLERSSYLNQEKTGQ